MLNAYQIDLDAIFEGICILTERDCWSGTADELLTALSSLNLSASLPRTPHHLCFYLGMLALPIIERVRIAWDTCGVLEFVVLQPQLKPNEFCKGREGILAPMQNE